MTLPQAPRHCRRPAVDHNPRQGQLALRRQQGADPACGPGPAQRRRRAQAHMQRLRQRLRAPPAGVQRADAGPSCLRCPAARRPTIIGPLPLSRKGRDSLHAVARLAPAWAPNWLRGWGVGAPARPGCQHITTHALQVTSSASQLISHFLCRQKAFSNMPGIRLCIHTVDKVCTHRVTVLDGADVGELARLVPRLPDGVPHAPLAVPVVLPQLLLLARARRRLCRCRASAHPIMGKHNPACVAVAG